MNDSGHRFTALRQWVLSHPLLAFPLFYLGWAYLFWVPVLLSDESVWAIWHAPFVWFTGYYANTTFNPELYWWLPMIVCQTLLIVQVYNRTGRSILAVLIFHGMMNFTGEWLRISPDMYPFMLTGNLLAAVLLVLWWNRKKV